MNAGTRDVTTVRLDAAPRDAGGAFCRRGEPVAVGVPVRRGALTSPRAVSIVDSAGRDVPAQTSASETWSDGTVRWLLVRFLAHTDARGCAAYHLIADGDERDRGDGAAAIRIDRLPMEIRIDTGRLTATVGQRVEVDAGGDRPSRLALDVWDAGDHPMEVRFERSTIEEEGPLYVRIRHDGAALTADGRPGLRVSMRLELFAGLPAIRCAVALTNPQRAQHRGGIWELGDPSSVLMRGATVRAELPEPPHAATIRYSAAPGEPWERTDAPLVVYQESSGGEAWASRNHVNAAGEVPLRLRGYQLTCGDVARRGLRATPSAQVRGAATAVAVATDRFWQNFPKAIRADSRSIAFDLFPRFGPDLYEIQPGERKTHAFTLLFGDDPVTDDPLEWVRAPLLVRPAPGACLDAEPLPFLPPFGSDPEADALLDDAILGPHCFIQKREEIDEYGWRHFGDLYADHEAVRSKNLISHYNNQYDAIAGFAAQYLRTSDARWWTLMDDLAAHVADIDVYHTSADKSAYSGGLFWHTCHYTDAGRSTHRSYPAAPGIAGGGPSAEHNYSTGLMLHHLLTGRPESRETALELAEWVIAMDTGSRTIFGWLARGQTGYASATASPDYHGPGRGAGNSIAVLLNAHRLSGERRFLAKAEELIARCIRPDDDIARLNLLDAERRWSYTVFLQALGRYLLHKAERRELDEPYAYARASLVHYARWMTQHEYPYLDKPAILEYPNETWAAQDLRKAEVFILAAMCASDDERPSFLSRAAYFHARSIETLQQSGTSWLTRPLVILLSTHGAVPWWRHAPEPHALPDCPLGELEERHGFVPLRARAMRRAKVLAAVLVATAAAGAWLL